MDSMQPSQAMATTIHCKKFVVLLFFLSFFFFFLKKKKEKKRRKKAKVLAEVAGGLKWKENGTKCLKIGLCAAMQ